MADIDTVTDCASTFGTAGIGVDRYFRRVTGALAVAHRIARRLTSPRGSVRWALDHGIDLREWMNESMDRAELVAMVNAARDEVLRDEAVSEADVQATFDDVASAVSLSVNGQTADGPFTVLVEVSAGTVKVIAIS